MALVADNDGGSVLDHRLIAEGKRNEEHVAETIADRRRQRRRCCKPWRTRVRPRAWRRAQVRALRGASAGNRQSLLPLPPAQGKTFLDERLRVTRVRAAIS